MKRKITKLWKGCTLSVGDVVEVEKLSDTMAKHSEEVVVQSRKKPSADDKAK